ncbi:hypothetical protein HYH02_012709 [Chlamydomonas schloesseri]|uniref:Uncharacterized protein n=1 Tax=Chlamydomonas schloesseri TaxID=2026947 RepID=A0A835W207_9CHLO|nr:hypothetical protein HYH02_012709 [Chlamydomonas schloesseri]|eukprot:KAG2433166.1 hypothetical protein HYH02_012709 [Chlamydomonas schloesseri]
MNNWASLTPELQLEVASHLPPGDVAGCLKFVDWSTYKNLHSSYEAVRLVADEPWPAQAFLLRWGQLEQPWRKLNVRQRRKLLCLAAGSGHPPSLAAALSHCGVSLRAEVMAAAAAAGDVAACQTLLDGGCCWGNSVTMAAAEHGRVEVLDWLQRLDFKFEEHTEDATEGLRGYACDDKYLERMLDNASEYDLEQQYPPTPAARSGHGRVLKWEEEEDMRLAVVRAAGEGGHAVLAAQEYRVIVDFASVGEHEMEAAGFPAPEPWNANGSSWLRAEPLLCGLACGCSLAELQQHGGAAVEAVRGRDNTGRAVVVQAAACSPTSDWAAKLDWLQEQWQLRSWGDAYDNAGQERWRRAAAAPGFTQRLQQLAAGRGFRPGNDVMATIAEVGNLEALKALVEWGLLSAGRDDNVGPLEGCAVYAAAGGHVHVLQWLRERLPAEEVWQERVRFSAAHHARGGALLWLMQQEVEQQELEQQEVEQQEVEQHELEQQELEQQEVEQHELGPVTQRKHQLGQLDRDKANRTGKKTKEKKAQDRMWDILKEQALLHADAAALRYLVEQCGKALDGPGDWDMLVCEASVELLEWASAQPGAEQQIAACGPSTLLAAAWAVGNLAAADWLLTSAGVGRLPRAQEDVCSRLHLAHLRFGELQWMLRALLARGGPTEDNKVAQRMWREPIEAVRAQGLATPRQLALLEEIEKELAERYKWPCKGKVGRGKKKRKQ